MAYIEEDYQTDYNEAYEQVLAQSMESFAVGKDSPLEKMFGLIDAARTTDDITVIEQLSLKKDAYMSLLQSITAQSQKTAMSIVDKKYKFHGELAQQTKQLALMDQQVQKAIADVSYVGAQETAMEEQVIDNRRIKALDSLSDTYGTFGAGGITLSSDMWSTYFGIVADLSGEAAPGSTTVTKVT